MKRAVFWDVVPCRYCVNRLLEERIASIFRAEEKRRKYASEEPV
jgi:deoxycytidylate deaminase